MQCTITEAKREVTDAEHPPQPYHNCNPFSNAPVPTNTPKPLNPNPIL